MEYKFRHQQNPSKIELRFREALSMAEIPHQPQIYIDGIGTIVDFLLPHNIVVYVDGVYWHAHPDMFDRNNLDPAQEVVVERDKRFNKELQAAGYTVLRFWGSDIRNDLPACISIVKEHLAAMDEQSRRQPSPPPG